MSQRGHELRAIREVDPQLRRPHPSPPHPNVFHALDLTPGIPPESSLPGVDTTARCLGDGLAFATHLDDNTKSAGEISDASSAERTDLYLKVICSSNTSLVEPVHHYSNKSTLLPPPLAELQKLADLTPNFAASATPVEQVSRALRRRLEPALVKRIVAEYEAGAATPSLCETYGLSKTGMLRLLRDEGVSLRRRPLTVDQVEVARKLYEHGHPMAAIATRLDTSYNNVRQRLIKEGVQLRPRGGSYR